jgi:acyl-CoA reductase-like NAD-dependent aldehyde dehydrogenase
MRNDDRRRGGWAEDVFPVINPATGQVFAEAPDASRKDLERAIAAAQEACVDWARRSERGDLLLECAKRLRGQAIRLARLLTR